MPASKECAAAKVLYYARLYSGRQLAENANYANIINGWSTSINRMATLLTSCNKCGTVECENLAKNVAIAWLKAFKIPVKTGIPAPPKAVSPCSTPPTSMNAAYKVATYINYYGGIDLKQTNPAFSTHLISTADKNALQAIINGYPTNIATIRNNLNCAGTTCKNQACEDAARGVAKHWLGQHPYQASGGTKGGGSTAPKPTGPDADCVNYGGLGGIADGACVAFKKLTKGAEAGVQNPLTQYLPIMLIGMGFLAILMLAKK